jgi:hypothetical protein
MGTVKKASPLTLQSNNIMGVGTRYYAAVPLNTGHYAEWRIYGQ